MKNKFIQDLLNEPAVLEIAEARMLRHLAMVEGARPHVIEHIHSQLVDKMGQLSERLVERIEAQGLAGNAANYKVCDGIAELKLYLDIISLTFNNDNITMAYRKKLHQLYEDQSDDIEQFLETNLEKEGQSLLNKLIKK